MTRLEKDLTDEVERLELENEVQKTAMAEAMFSADSAEARMENLVRDVERLREFEPKGGQQVGPSVGPLARLKQENRDLKAALSRADATIVWFEMRKAASEALLEVAEKAGRHVFSREFHDATKACRDAFK
jgi:hypothetical protein